MKATEEEEEEVATELELQRLDGEGSGAAVVVDVVRRRRRGSGPSPAAAAAGKVVRTWNRIPGLGLLLAFAAGIFFSFASLTIKLLTEVHPLTILFGRSVIQLTVFLPVCVYRSYAPWGERGERLALCGRILFGSMAISGLYYSVRIMPLADATTIVFSSPAFTGIFACLILGEPCGVFEVATVVVVLVGVVLVCRPTFLFGGAATYPQQLEGTLAAANSSVTQALVFVCLRKLRRTPSSVIIVSFSLVVALECVVVLSLLGGFPRIPLCGREAALYLACGLLSSAGQFLMTTATKMERAGPLSLVRSTDIIIAFVFQIALLGDLPTWSSLLGAAVVCLAVVNMGLRKWCKERRTASRGQQAVAGIETQVDQSLSWYRRCLS